MNLRNLAPWGFSLAALALGLSMYASAQVKPVVTKPNETIRSLSDPLNALKLRVEGLEEKVEALEKENRSLKAAVAPLPGVAEKANFLYSEHQRPAGILGVRRKVVQKNSWDRVPGNAYVVVYER